MSMTVHDEPEPRDSLVRGDFRDSTTRYTVRASSAVAPDSFQVSANGNSADIVLIVSGINSGRLHATWGDGWRAFNPEWKIWVEDMSFKVFYGVALAGKGSGPSNDGLGPVRFCNG